MLEQNIILKVEGMTCAHCARTVERHARETPGVEEVHVDLDEGKLTARVVEGTARADLVAAVYAAGYEVNE